MGSILGAGAGPSRVCTLAQRGGIQVAATPIRLPRSSRAPRIACTADTWKESETALLSAGWPAVGQRAASLGCTSPANVPSSLPWPYIYPGSSGGSCYTTQNITHQHQQRTLSSCLACLRSVSIRHSAMSSSAKPPSRSASTFCGREGKGYSSWLWVGGCMSGVRWVRAIIVHRLAHEVTPLTGVRHMRANLCGGPSKKQNKKKHKRAAQGRTCGSRSSALSNLSAAFPNSRAASCSGREQAGAAHRGALCGLAHKCRLAHNCRNTGPGGSMAGRGGQPTCSSSC